MCVWEREPERKRGQREGKKEARKGRKKQGSDGRRGRGEGGLKEAQIYMSSIEMGMDGLLHALLCLMRVSPTIYS